MHCATYFPDSENAQLPVDVAVVIPTILRPEVLRAVESVYSQQGVGRVQILVGVDVAKGAVEDLLDLLGRRPAHVSAFLLQLPHSTSLRNGGIHSASDGGSLRAILSLMANSRRVAYLDDDNYWLPGHLASLLGAIEGKAWAFSLRWLVDEVTGKSIVIDRWDSLGAGQGRFASIGGLVDTNCLLVDKVCCAHALGRWAESFDGRAGVTADRNFFAGIRELPSLGTGEATVMYSIRRTNVLWNLIRQAGVSFDLGHGWAGAN